MKIIHVIPCLLRGGAERLAIDICNELQKHPDLDVVLIMLKDNTSYKIESSTLNLHLIPSKFLPSLSGKSMASIDELQNFITNFKPDVIHSHLFESEIILSQIDIGIAKRVVHFHDNMSQFRPFSLKGNLKKNITDFYERKIVVNSYANETTTFIGISKHTMDYMNKVLPESFQKMELSNAIHVSNFANPTSYQMGSIETCMIGSLVPKKNQILAIQTIEVLKNRGIQLQLKIVGDGPLRKELENYVSINKLENQVHFTGIHHKPEEILWKSRFYLHTATYEPFGLVILEAMAAGLPVISTNGGGNVNLVQNGWNGYLVQECDPNILADKIEILLQNPEHSLQMSANSIEFARQFDIQEYCEKLIEIYKA